MLLSNGGSGAGSAPSQALRVLLDGLAKVDLHHCVKGPFYDAMGAKLRQMAQTRSNELVTAEFPSMVENLVRARLAVHASSIG